MRYKLLLILLIIPLTLNAQSLAERQKTFYSILDKSKTPEGKIKAAEGIAKDSKSNLRIDAINYLIAKKSYRSAQVMSNLIQDENLREFAIYGVGELNIQEATPSVIQSLKDENQNTRGNAYRALQKMYPKDFNIEFHYDDSPEQRNKTVKNIEDWWLQNRERLKNTSLKDKTDKEKKEAEMRWQTYGKGYLDRPAQ